MKIASRNECVLGLVPPTPTIQIKIRYLDFAFTEHKKLNEREEKIMKILYAALFLGKVLGMST